MFIFIPIYLLSCAGVSVNFMREKGNRIKVKCSFDSFIIIIVIIIHCCCIIHCFHQLA